MELLDLLFPILTTFLTSLALSLILLFRTPFRRCYPPRVSPSSSSDASDSVSLYEGTVWHERRRPVRHTLKYPVRYALFDLDHARQAPPDHLSAGEARRVAETNDHLLLTIPRSLGYEQNPWSLYYCYEKEGSSQHLKKCIAEVTKTPWGERVSFVFNPISDLLAKPLHVSPFMDMLGNWNIRAKSPGEYLNVSISVQHPQLGDYFVATLRAKRVASVLVSHHVMFFCLMPHKVALWIYWNAFKLWWKNVSFIQHPRYSNPEYRKEALIRDQKPRCCAAVGGNTDNYLQVEQSDLRYQADRNRGDRWFAWSDAMWPWS